MTLHDYIFVAENMTPDRNGAFLESFAVLTYCLFLEEFRFARTYLQNSSIHGQGLFPGEDIRRRNFDGLCFARSGSSVMEA